jgi:hypothetical protein
MSSHVWQHACTTIQIQYIEMPELKLTLPQIRRLCDLPEQVCDPAIAALEHTGFLWRAPDGTYVRRALGRPGRTARTPFSDPVLGSLALVNHPGE